MQIVLIKFLKAQFDPVILSQFCIKFIQDEFYFFLNQRQPSHPLSIERPCAGQRFHSLCPSVFFQISGPADDIIKRRGDLGGRIFKDSLYRKIFFIFVPDGFPDGSSGDFRKNQSPFSGKWKCCWVNSVHPWRGLRAKDN